MTPNEALQYYIAIKLHFSTDYDAIKYQFKLKRPASYPKRNDKLFFNRLARQPDPKGLVLANLALDPNLWVGKLFEQKQVERYWAWKRYQEAQSHYFAEEIKLLEPNTFKNEDGHLPESIRLFLSGKLSLDTLTILKDFIRFDLLWDATLADNPIWENLKKVLTKYRPFISFDRQKILSIMTKQFLT